MNIGKNKGFIIYLSVILALIALCFEFLILPNHYKMTREMALFGFAAVPGMTVDDTHINDMGFTGDVISPHKEHGTVRILTLGGSTLFDREMTEKLKEHFQSRSDTPVEILGAALRTHTSMSSLLKYRMLSDYQVDYVLIYHGINDLFVNHVPKQYFHDDYSHMSPWYERSALLNNSLLIRFFYNNVVWGRKIFGDNKADYIYPNDNNRSENSMEFISEKLFRRNITTIVEEVRKNNSIPVLMTFAWTTPENYTREAFIKNNVGYNKSIHYHSYPVELWGTVSYVKNGLRIHNNVLKEIAKKYDTLLIDQESEMGKDLRWFEDVCHFSEEGAEKFAENVASYFATRGLF